MCKGGENTPEISCFGLKPLLPLPQAPHHASSHPPADSHAHSLTPVTSKATEMTKPNRKHVKTPSRSIDQQTKAFFIKYSKPGSCSNPHLEMSRAPLIPAPAGPSPRPLPRPGQRHSGPWKPEQLTYGRGGKLLGAWPLGDSTQQCFQRVGQRPVPTGLRRNKEGQFIAGGS